MQNPNDSTFPETLCPNCLIKIKKKDIGICENCGFDLNKQAEVEFLEMLSEINKCPNCSIQIKNYEIGICEKCGATLKSIFKKYKIKKEFVEVPSEVIKCPNCSVQINNYEIGICEKCGADLKSNFKEYKINEYITLRLENKKTHVYVNGKRFLPFDKVVKIYKQSMLKNRIIEGTMDLRSRFQNRILTPEQEFWEHCSNLQAWVETFLYDNKYDTGVLMSNISFPLLKRLTDAGDPFAKKAFKKEIAQRLESGIPSVVQYLIIHLYHFTSVEFKT
ncbi:MAG: hypothetical protein ACW96X_12400, partial [Promethearchaeota archaeon]